MYDTAEGKMMHKLNAHRDNIHSLSYSRDGKMMYTFIHVFTVGEVMYTFTLIL